MAIILTYDIPSKHSEFKQQMFDKGYKDSIQGTSCPVIYFPNTTLYHKNKLPKESLVDTQEICKNLGIKLVRFVSTDWNPNSFVAICGLPFNY